jgi:hypothetical protein
VDLLQVFHHRDDNSDCAKIHCFLDIAFRRIGDAHERHGRGAFAVSDHAGDILIGKRAVLHFDPKEVEAGIRHRAV